MATPKNRSVMKAFSLLQSFHRPDEWLTSSELSRRANLPEASGYRLVQTLEGIGAVIRDTRGRYRPGMLLLTLSQDIVAQELWGKAAQTLLNGLARDLDVSVHVGVLEDDMVTYVARAGKPRLGLPIGIGMQFEAYCTALGKALLASLDDDALNAFLCEGELIALTERTIVHADQLRTGLARIRSEGYALDDREMLDSMCCVAAPIRDAAGSVVAAISVTEDADRLTAPRQQQLRGAITQAAMSVGERLFPRVEDAPRTPQLRAGARPAATCAVRW